MGKPLSSMRASVNRLRIVSPNNTPFLNSCNRSTFVSTRSSSPTFTRVDEDGPHASSPGTSPPRAGFVSVAVACEEASGMRSSGPSPAARITAERACRDAHPSRQMPSVSRSPRRDDADVEVEAVRTLAARRGTVLTTHVAGARIDDTRTDISVYRRSVAPRGTALTLAICHRTRTGRHVLTSKASHTGRFRICTARPGEGSRTLRCDLVTPICRANPRSMSASANGGLSEKGFAPPALPPSRS